MEKHLLVILKVLDYMLPDFKVNRTPAENESSLLYTVNNLLIKQSRHGVWLHYSQGTRSPFATNYMLFQLCTIPEFVSLLLLRDQKVSEAPGCTG